MTDKTGGPAFPFGQVSELTGQVINGYHNDGMTLRDYFAAKAISDLAGRLYQGFSAEAIARESYELADAMLAERNK